MAVFARDSVVVADGALERDGRLPGDGHVADEAKGVEVCLVVFGEVGCHLELVTGSYPFAQLLVSILRRMDLPAGMTDRKNDYVIYMKEGDAILDFLGMLQAEKAVEEFEIARNVKEVRNQVNRLVNCETANLQKTVDAAGRQIDAIRRLAAAGHLAGLPGSLRETAEVRLAHPDASFSELAELLGIGKSGINHRLRKLAKLAADLSEGE